MIPFAWAAASPFRDGCRDEHGIAPRQRRPRDPLPQRFPFEELHDGKGNAVSKAELVDRQNARVGQRSDGARLGLETLSHGRIDSDVIRHHLDGDVALEPNVARPIDVPMPPDPSGDITSYCARRVPGGSNAGFRMLNAECARPDRLRQGYGGPPKLHAQAEGRAYA